MPSLCNKPMPSRSRYNAIQGRFCQREAGHKGRCDEFHYLEDLATGHRAVATKIIRDATMTTGAAWKSDEAGPNRILRWVMLLSDADLKRFGINMAGLKPQVVAKLREKAADLLGREAPTSVELHELLPCVEATKKGRKGRAGSGCRHYYANHVSAQRRKHVPILFDRQFERNSDPPSRTAT